MSDTVIKKPKVKAVVTKVEHKTYAEVNGECLIISNLSFYPNLVEGQQIIGEVMTFNIIDAQRVFTPDGEHKRFHIWKV